MGSGQPAAVKHVRCSGVRMMQHAASSPSRTRSFMQQKTTPYMQTSCKHTLRSERCMRAMHAYAHAPMLACMLRVHACAALMRSSRP
eukprot:266719-Chlamydomonas_euryale.AAC.8